MATGLAVDVETRCRLPVAVQSAGRHALLAQPTQAASAVGASPVEARVTLEKRFADRPLQHAKRAVTSPKCIVLACKHEPAFTFQERSREAVAWGVGRQACSFEPNKSEMVSVLYCTTARSAAGAPPDSIDLRLQNGSIPLVLDTCSRQPFTSDARHARTTHRSHCRPTVSFREDGNLSARSLDSRWTSSRHGTSGAGGMVVAWRRWRGVPMAMTRLRRPRPCCHSQPSTA